MGHFWHCRWNNAPLSTELLSVVYEAIRSDVNSLFIHCNFSPIVQRT
jgi:hypothetical protein